MLNFDPDRYIRIQRGAVDLAAPLDAVLTEQLDRGAQNIFFVGTGGVAFLLQPAVRLLQTRSSFPAFTEMAAELVEADSVNLGPGSIVVMPSVSGTTKESIRALEFAKSKGAFVLSLVGTADSPLGQLADKSFVNPVADDTSSESFYLQSLLIALSIMRARGEVTEYDRIVSELKLLPTLLVDVKSAFEDRADAFAEEIKDEQHHIFTSAGNSWFEAWYFAMCILEEMQWIWTRPVHASDFFHGTLELLEPDTSVILLKGEDAGRPLVDRAERFARSVSSKVRVFDSRDFALPGVSDDVRALVSPVLFAATFERIAAHLEIDRDHPLVTRRYYKKGDF